MSTDHADWISNYRESNPTTSELQEWGEELLRNAETLRAFVRMQMLEHQLNETFRIDELLTQVVEVPAQKKRTKLAVVFLAASIFVALVLTAVYRNSVTPQPELPLATLHSAEGVTWTSAPIEPGASLLANRKLELRAGTAEIRFKDGTALELLGPAAFEIAEAGEGVLFAGAVRIAVKSDTEVFLLQTPAADLRCTPGTSMYVRYEEIGGDFQADVFQGRVVLTRKNSPTDRTIELTEQFGVRINGRTGELTKVKVHLDIANAELPTKKPPVTVSLVDWIEQEQALNEQGFQVNFKNGQYCRRPQAQVFVGMFMPDGRRAPNRLDALGRTYGEFPSLENAKRFNFGVAVMDEEATKALWESARIEAGLSNEGPPPKTSPKLEQQALASGRWTRQPPPKKFVGILNFGMTFDLHGIVHEHTGAIPRRFIAQVGKTGGKELSGDAQAWVFVDGELRYSVQNQNDAHGPAAVSIPLARQDRYLTIVAVEPEGSSPADWVIFGDPIVELDTAGSLPSTEKPQAR
jgi:ferric-dicitrate binding protein FerR (iron transport regulator)